MDRKTFDELVVLNKSNQADFEKYRLQEIEKLINSCKPRNKEKLLQLQWKLDTIRETNTPLAATEQMFGMLNENLESLSVQCEKLIKKVEEVQCLAKELT